MAMTNTERSREYRARQKAKGLPDSSSVGRSERKAWKNFNEFGRSAKPFTGCDGEGAGTDELGRQLYLLFRMGDRELFTGSHLSTEELLDFICDHPADEILVGFAFGYDVTMMLRDLDRERLNRLFEPKDMSEGRSRYTWYKNFDIEYLPKQYFRVRRMRIEIDDQGQRRRVVAGATRTIFETFGFFQKSFVKVIGEFDCGTPEQRERIAINKARRGDFVEMTDEERSYCAMEVELLAELMEKLREYCHAAGIKPRSWNGAGKLASALHKMHETPRAEMVQERVPEAVANMANMAYYGGRFEITRTGMINQKVYEYDIRSAYPDAMRFLPCLEHGRWKKGDCSKLAGDTLFVANVRFNHLDNGAGHMCGLPVRSREGHLYWPLQGAGTYWSPEIRAAEGLGAKIDYKGEGWIYERTCHCEPFDWVEPLYDYRRSIGSSGPGYPIKLGINSLYGKLAQRKGAGPYANMVWAGLITALTRAKIMSAIRIAPGRIVMVATDGIYSLDPLPELECGERLGQWEHEELDGLFIVQPGLYWSPNKRKKKSRGLPGKFFEEPGRTEGFENEWITFKHRFDLCSDLVFPSSSVPMVNFIGLKLALARNKPELAGTWKDEQRTISFDYRNKREGHIWRDDHIITSCKPGGPMTISLPHKDFLKAGGNEPWEAARAMLEDQPDYVDLGPPFKD